MIAVEFIQIDRAEGPAEACGVTRHLSWACAERRILNICRTAPARGGYDKCDFEIHWKDGEVYRGRYDAAAPGCRAYEGTLAAHVRRFLEFLTGEHCPDHMTPERYAQIVKRGGNDCADAKRMLATYEIGGAA
ncbi:hypothetical protein [Thiocapsa sp. N5-Cardenillas]|uniref:hypothetical protein n=1 Tax=Thiocapsa sp. N5-Cardenillas TaxID=3137397 RepID=UPI0035B2AAEF